jgi:hypothetical protein
VPLLVTYCTIVAFANRSGLRLITVADVRYVLHLRTGVKSSEFGSDPRAHSVSAGRGMAGRVRNNEGGRHGVRQRLATVIWAETGAIWACLSSHWHSSFSDDIQMIFNNLFMI